MRFSGYPLLRIVLCIIGIAGFTTCPPAEAMETYTVDATHSAALFKVKHFGISFIAGTFSDISGTIVMDRAKPENSMVEIAIQTAGVNTHLKKRDDHLRSADFFDVKKYPTMGFKSLRVRPLKDDRVEVTGLFFLHGKTKTITTMVEFLGDTGVPWGQHRAGFETSFRINRSDYGMDKLPGPVGNDIRINLLIEAVRMDAPGKGAGD